jgi:hypothetical protein
VNINDAAIMKRNNGRQTESKQFKEKETHEQLWVGGFKPTTLLSRKSVLPIEVAILGQLYELCNALSQIRI